MNDLDFVPVSGVISILVRGFLLCLQMRHEDGTKSKSFIRRLSGFGETFINAVSSRNNDDVGSSITSSAVKMTINSNDGNGSNIIVTESRANTTPVVETRGATEQISAVNRSAAILSPFAIGSSTRIAKNPIKLASKHLPLVFKSPLMTTKTRKSVAFRDVLSKEKKRVRNSLVQRRRGTPHKASTKSIAVLSSISKSKPGISHPIANSRILQTNTKVGLTDESIGSLAHFVPRKKKHTSHLLTDSNIIRRSSLDPSQFVEKKRARKDREATNVAIAKRILENTPLVNSDIFLPKSSDLSMFGPPSQGFPVQQVHKGNCRILGKNQVGGNRLMKVSPQKKSETIRERQEACAFSPDQKL